MNDPTAKMQNPAGLYSMVTQLPSQQQQPALDQLSQTGLAPTEAILYVKNQLDRLRAARQAPPPTTVMQDMQAQIQQAQMPQMQAPLQSPAQSPIQPASQGLPSLPVQNVGQPQNYAGGGIVAFQNRGLVEEETSPFGRWITAGLGERESRIAQEQLRNRLARDIASRYGRFAAPEGIFAAQSDVQRQQAQDLIRRLPTMSTEEMQAVLTSGPGALTLRDQAARQAGGAKYMQGMQEAIKRVPSAPATAQREQAGLPAARPRLEPVIPTAERMAAPEKTPNDYLAEIEALGREKGIGKAISDREKVLAARQAASEKDLADRSRMSRAQAFFKMAEESAKPGGTFLKGATAGLSQYAEAKQALADRRQELKERAEDLQFTLAQAKEQQALGNMEAARRLFEKAEADKQQLAKEAREHQRDMEKIAAQEAGAKERTGMQVGAQKEIAGVTAAARAGQAQAAAQQRVATAAKTAAENSMEYQQLQTQLTSKQITPEQAQAIYDALVKREIQKILRAQQIAGGVESEPVENAADPLGIR